jgi:ParB family chromosome partitioning protein
VRPTRDAPHSHFPCTTIRFTHEVARVAVLAPATAGTGHVLVKEHSVTTIEVPAQRTDDSPIEADVVQAADGTTAPVSTDEVADAALTAEEREAEYYTIVWAAPATLHIGPNVRTENAVPDEDKVRDIKKRGVQSPIKGYRDEAGNLVITVGQLRTLGAVQAGRETVPVWVQPPPSEDEKEAAITRIVDQVNENDLRTPMTRGDIYRAHQQLEAFGLSVTAIARRLSRRKKVVENSLKVGASELASKAADKYDLDLEQAAVIVEFENYGDLDTAKELIVTAVENPNNFTALAQRKRNDRAETERMRALTETLISNLTTAGVTILDSTVPDWTGTARSLDKLRATPNTDPGTELTAEAHAGCPGHAAWITYEYDETDRKIPVAEYGCVDFRTHGHALGGCPAGQVEYDRTGAHRSGATDDSTDDATATAAIELARQQGRIINRWVRENNLNWDAAVDARISWLASFAQRQTAPKGAQVFLATQKAQGSPDLRRAMERHHPLAHRLLKLDQPDYGTSGELVKRIAKATPAKATVYDVFLTLAAMEDRLQRNAWRTPTGSEALYLSTIIGWGHKASDVELKVLNPEREQDVIAAALGISDDGEETTEPAADTDGSGEEEGDGPGQDDCSPTDVVVDDVEGPDAEQDAEIDEHVDSGDGADLAEFAGAVS